MTRNVDLVGSDDSDITAYDPRKYSSLQGYADDVVELVLGNLVSNAMTYGAATAPVIVHSTVEAATFAISVHNLGPAIDPASR